MNNKIKINIIRKFGALFTTRNERLLIDKEHYEILKDYKFYDTGTPNKKTGKGWYFMTFINVNGKRKGVYIHQLVMCLKNGLPLGDNSYVSQGLDIDHINGNPKDNRSFNLRYLPKSENRRHHKDIVLK